MVNVGATWGLAPVPLLFLRYLRCKGNVRISYRYLEGLAGAGDYPGDSEAYYFAIGIPGLKCNHELKTVAVEHFWYDVATGASAQFNVGFAKIDQFKLAEVFGVRACGDCRA